MKIVLLLLFVLSIHSLTIAQWEMVSNGMGNKQVYGLITDDPYVFAGTASAGVFRTADMCTNWTAQNNGISGSFACEISSINNNLFTGIYLGSTFRPTDDGENWKEVNEGLTNKGILSLVSDNTYLDAGTRDSGVYRHNLNNILDVKTISFEIPSYYYLSQNYPNPFNPGTTIQFSIPEKRHVMLEVFNTLGEKVSTLLSEELNTGTYKYELNTSNLPSSVYLYKGQSSNFSTSKKMVLLR